MAYAQRGPFSLVEQGQPGSRAPSAVPWSSSRGKQLMCIKAGQHSARSPKHYPTWKMNEDRARKRAARLALQQERAEVQSHLEHPPWMVAAYWVGRFHPLSVNPIRWDLQFGLGGVPTSNQ